MSLVKLIERIIERNGPRHIQAKVVSVDEAAATCEAEPLDGGAPLLEIKLNNANAVNIGLAPVPKIGSVVTVTMLNPAVGFVSLFGELEKVIVTAASIQFNDGSLGGLVKWPDLLNQLNQEKSRVSTFFDTFLNTVPVPSDGGAAIQTAVKTAMSGQTAADYSGLENESIKHG